MVSMEMGDEYTSDNRGGYIGENELPLRSLSWVKEKPFIIPSKEIRSVISSARGLLAGRAEHNKVLDTH